MEDILQEFGYAFDMDELEREIRAVKGRAPSAGEKRFYKASAPFIVMAYQRGIHYFCTT